MVWSPNPVAFSVFGLNIAWYGISWSLAILCGYFIFLYFFKNEKKDISKLVPFIQYVFIGVLLGARLFEMLYYQLDSFISDPMLFFRFREGGLASHGAMIGTILAILLFVKNNKDFSFWWLLDRSVIVVSLQGAIIRIGNFFNSELYGKLTDVAWAVKFVYVDFENRHPVQLYEALWLLVCFLLFMYLYKTGRRKDAYFTSLFLIVILGGRVVLEFLKESDLVFYYFSQTQIASIFGVSIGIFIFFRKQLMFIK